MHPENLRAAVVAIAGVCWLTACETASTGSTDPLRDGDGRQGDGSGPALVAGGETSEFSGGNVVAGYCPHVESRTELELGRDEVARLVALAEGRHEIPLRWRREFPDERVRGFQERTSLLLDVRVIAAEDVVCVSSPGDTGYETSGYRERLRRLELSVELSTADGAVRAAFQRPFVSAADASGGRYLSGGEILPIDQLEGTLELGVDPGLEVASSTLSADIAFGEQGVSGALTPWIILPGPYDIGGGRPSWVPVQGAFPAPDEGCTFGSLVPLDEVSDVLGETPRAAYELARASLPAQPVTAAWENTSQWPATLTWTELSLRAGAATHACSDGNAVDVHASLSLESADGVVRAEYPAVANVSLRPARAGEPRSAADVSLSAGLRWAPPDEFEALAGIGELDLDLAEYGGLHVYQSFDVARGELRGALRVSQWENHVEASAEVPGLVWCAGPGCERYWCVRTSPDDGSCSEL